MYVGKYSWCLYVGTLLFCYKYNRLATPHCDTDTIVFSNTAWKLYSIPFFIGFPTVSNTFKFAVKNYLQYYELVECLYLV